MKNDYRNFRLCASVKDSDEKKCREEISRFGFAELRGDLCHLSVPQVETLVSSHPGIIFTFRFSAKEEKAALEQTLAAIGKGVMLVDIDCRAPESFFKKVKSAISKQSGKSRTKLIVSWHSDKTPSLEKMTERVSVCRNLGADIVKIVPYANSLEEASRVLKLYHTRPGFPLIAFAAGEAGTFTRIACLGLGAPFTYCKASGETAHGQLSWEEMQEHISGEENHCRIGNLSESELFSGFVSVPCSKSIAQRALLAAAITKGQSILRNFEPCQDIDNAIAFARKCGCVVKATRDGSSAKGEKMLIIRSAGIDKWKSFLLANVGESALLARLLMPVSAYASSIRSHSSRSSKISVTGGGSLLKRDFSTCIENLDAAGIKCEGTRTAENYHLPVKISGATFKRNFTISGEKTSQLVSGLLFVLPLLNHETVMTVENAVSIPFIEMTIKVLAAFGINIEMQRQKRTLVFRIDGMQTYNPVDMFMESDWSSASNFLVLGAIASAISNRNGGGEGLTVKKMNCGSNQADEVILGVLEKCGCAIGKEKPEKNEFATFSDKQNIRRSFYQGLNNISVQTERLTGFRFDATDSPDLFPILSTLAVNCKGQSRIKGVGRLTHKESNRAVSILQEFSKMGYHLSINEDELVIEGFGGKVPAYAEKEAPERIYCSSHNDHRIAMAIIICAMTRNHQNEKKTELYLDDIKCIDKSFPTFIKRLKFKLGPAQKELR